MANIAGRNFRFVLAPVTAAIFYAVNFNYICGVTPKGLRKTEVAPILQESFFNNYLFLEQPRILPAAARTIDLNLDSEKYLQNNFDHV